MSLTNNPQQQFLEELAGALEQVGIGLEPCAPRDEFGRGWSGVVLPYQGGKLPGWWWDGESELPALAFAMLDVLEANDFDPRFHRTVARMERYECVAPHGRSQKLSQTGAGATRTEAIARTLIKASQAGLTKYEKEQNQ